MPVFLFNSGVFMNILSIKLILLKNTDSAHNGLFALELGALKGQARLIGINVQQLTTGAAIGREGRVVEADKGLAHLLEFGHSVLSD